MRRVAVFVLLIALGTVVHATEAPMPNRAARVRPPRIPRDVDVLTDVVYGTGGGRPLKLDIIRPKNLPSAPMPVLVWIHGGAWMAGNKRSGVGLLAPFAKRGYFCAAIEYRFSQEALFPAQIEDCKCAIRYLRAHAEEYRIDPNRIGVWGASAGGHLAALLGASGDAKELEGNGGWPEQSSRVQAVCDWFGPTDFLNLVEDPVSRGLPEGPSPEDRLVGGPIAEQKEKAIQASPITYVTADDPPFLIMHGNEDRLVPVNQSERFHEALKKAGVDATLHIVEGAGHGFRGKDILAMVERFFDTHLLQVPTQTTMLIRPWYLDLCA